MVSQRCHMAHVREQRSHRRRYRRAVKERQSRERGATPRGDTGRRAAGVRPRPAAQRARRDSFEDKRLCGDGRGARAEESAQLRRGVARGRCPSGTEKAELRGHGEAAEEVQVGCGARAGHAADSDVSRPQRGEAHPEGAVRLKARVACERLGAPEARLQENHRSKLG